jgi:hypothetical protein
MIKKKSFPAAKRGESAGNHLVESINGEATFGLPKGVKFVEIEPARSHGS